MKHLRYIFLLYIINLTFSCSTVINADLLIIDGIVYDGIDSRSKIVDIAIKDDKIIYVGKNRRHSIKTNKIINAKDLIISPGFIDTHTHSDRDLNKKETSHNLPFLKQGVTTVVVGNDGDSFYPITDYKALYNKQGIGTNVVMLVGHGTIRNKVLGNSNKNPTTIELNIMKSLIDQEMNAGAFGMSTGLFYSPGSYSKTEEIISLAQTVSESDGIYDTHLRDESNYNIGLISAIKEVIEIGLKAKIPVQISHIKCLGRDVWHKSDSIIKLIEFHRSKGLEITANQYPYDASATSLKGAVVPRWAESGGKDSLFIRFNNNEFKSKILSETRLNIFRRDGANKLLIVNSKNLNIIGKNLLELSEMFNNSPEETVYKLIKSENVRVASFNMIEEDIIKFMKQSWVFTGSDGNTGHPRKYGSFPKKYSEYVREKKVISISDFINNSTSKPAEFLKIKKRGKIKEGYFADIIVFDPISFKDRADYSNSFQYSDGLIYSIINGQLVIDKKTYTKKLNGRVLEK